jgi:PRTRC genetic system protein C
MKVSSVIREFRFNGLILPDPNPQETPEGVRDSYVGAYPELATAVVEGPEFKDNKMIYHFRRSVGVKG